MKTKKRGALQMHRMQERWRAMTARYGSNVRTMSVYDQLVVTFSDPGLPGKKIVITVFRPGRSADARWVWKANGTRDDGRYGWIATSGAGGDSSREAALRDAKRALSLTERHRLGEATENPITGAQVAVTAVGAAALLGTIYLATRPKTAASTSTASGNQPQNASLNDGTPTSSQGVWRPVTTLKQGSTYRVSANVRELATAQGVKLWTDKEAPPADWPQDDRGAGRFRAEGVWTQQTMDVGTIPPSSGIVLKVYELQSGTTAGASNGAMTLGMGGSDPISRASSNDKTTAIVGTLSLLGGGAAGGFIGGHDHRVAGVILGALAGGMIGGLGLTLAS